MAADGVFSAADGVFSTPLGRQFMSDIRWSAWVCTRGALLESGQLKILDVFL